MLLRLVGVIAFIWVLLYLTLPVSPLYLMARSEQVDLLSSKVAYLGAGVFPSLIMAVIGIVLVFGADPLSRRLFQGAEDGFAIGRSDVEALGFAIAGLTVFGVSIPGLMGSAARVVSVLNKIGDEPGHTDFPWRDAVGYGVQAFVGLALFFGSRRFAAWWSRRRAEGPAGAPEP